MKDAFDDLERDLRAAVRARRRRRLPSAPVFAVIGALVLGGGGAVAATQIARDPHVDREGEKLAMQAATDTRRAPGCEHPTRFTHSVIDGPLLPSIARALPALTRPAAHPAPLPRSVTGAVLRDTSRTVDLGDVRLRIYVVQGPDAISHADPEACLAARRARVAELTADRSTAVRVAAERAVMRLRSTAPGLQTLYVNVLLGPGEGGFGVGLRLRPGDAVPRGIVTTGGGLSLGIADPRAVRVRVGLTVGACGRRPLRDRGARHGDRARRGRLRHTPNVSVRPPYFCPMTMCSLRARRSYAADQRVIGWRTRWSSAIVEAGVRRPFAAVSAFAAVR